MDKILYSICPNYDKYININERRFDLIISDTTKYLLKIVPFNEKASLDMIILGTCPLEISNKGYLGWHLYSNFKDFITEKNMSLLEIKEKLKDKKIQDELELLFNISQKYIIGPIMKIILQKSNTMIRNQMNNYLNLNKLEEKINKQKGWIINELYERLVVQYLMERSNTRNAYYKTISPDDYKPPEFELPNPKYSKLHTRCLKEVKKVIEKLNNNSSDNYEIINEFAYNLEGYSKKAKADILITKNGICHGIIEADGIQHYEYSPHFHNPNNDRKNNEAGKKIFLKLQEKDEKKNIESKKICNGKDPLRIKYDTKQPDINKKIEEWI